jgi:hypothetical protein
MVMEKYPIGIQTFSKIRESRHSGKSIIEVGVAFSNANKNVSGWLSNI